MAKTAKNKSTAETAAPLTGWERRQHLKRQQIISAATSLFLEHGFGQVSMDAIVEASSVSKRTLYNYYESKEQLFLDVIQSQIGELWPALEITDKDVPLEDKLRDIARQMFAIAMKPEPLALYRTMIGESQRFPDLTEQFHEVSAGRAKDALAHLLADEGRRAGLVIENRHDAADVFFDLLVGSVLMRTLLGLEKPISGKQITAHADQAVARFLRIFGR